MSSGAEDREWLLESAIDGRDLKVGMRITFTAYRDDPVTGQEQTAVIDGVISSIEPNPEKPGRQVVQIQMGDWS